MIVAVPGKVEVAGRRTPEDRLDAADFAAVAAAALAGEDAQICKAALAYYTGPYLPDDRYEDWALPRAEELSRLHMALVLRHARIVAKSGSANERISAWQAVLDADPCDEEAAYALMRVLAEGNRIAEALRVHAALAVALRAALDVSPAAPIERLRTSLVARRRLVVPDSADPSTSPSSAVDGVASGPADQFAYRDDQLYRSTARAGRRAGTAPSSPAADPDRDRRFRQNTPGPACGVYHDWALSGRYVVG